jgi:phenylacetate-CoA ligase
MIKFKGTTLYPPALFDMLNEMEYIQEYVAEVYSNEIGMDEVKLHIAPTSNSEEIDRRIKAYLQAKLRVIPHVQYISLEQVQKLQFPEGGRKAIKFIDRRG